MAKRGAKNNRATARVRAVLDAGIRVAAMEVLRSF
jgi:hypothetical protein